MRRKQLFALALAGVLSFSVTPTGLLADDMSDAPAVAASAEPGAEEAAQEQPAQPETPAAETPAAEAAADTPAPEAPTEAPTEAPAEAPTQAPTEAPTEAPTQAPTEAPAEPEQVPVDIGSDETPAAAATAAPTATAVPAATATPVPTATPTVAPTETPTPVPEDTKTKAVTNEAELIAAIAEADGSDTAVIDIANDIELTQTVNIPEGKKICLVTMASAAEISRAAGFTGDMFEVDGTLSFLKANKAGDINETGGSLTIDGALIDGTAAGSIVHVNDDAIFAIDDSAELTGNRTTAKGGAVYSDGLVLLLGGSIWGNTAEDGGAIYANNLVSIEKSADVTGNYASDGVKKNNIALAGSALLVVDGAITIGRAGVHAVDPAEGKTIVQLSETAAAETTLAEALSSIELDDESDYKLNAAGSLVAAEAVSIDEPDATPTPIPSITPELGRVSGPEWIDETTAAITCTADMDGWYYAAAARESDEVPEFEVNEDGIPVRAGEDFTVTVTVPEDEDQYCIYVLIKGENNTLSSKKKAPLDSTTRPGHEAAAEEDTETEAVEEAVEAIGAAEEETTEETEAVEEEATEEAEAEETEESEEEITEETEEEETEETEEETTEETEEEEASEEETEEKPEAVGEGETPTEVQMTAAKLTDADILIKKNRAIPFTLSFVNESDKDIWTIDTVSVVDKDYETVSTLSVEKGKTEGYQIVPSEDIKEAGKYILVVNLTTESEEAATKTATAEISFKNSGYTVADVKDTKITGLEGSYYFFPGYSYDFSATGAGPETASNIGDTRLVPRSFALVGEKQVTKFENTTSDLTKSAKVYSTDGIAVAKDNSFRVYFQVWEWNGTEWVAQNELAYKTIKVKSLALPQKGKETVTLDIAEPTTTKTFTLTGFSSDLKIKSSNKDVATGSIKKTSGSSSDGTYEVSITGKKAQTAILTAYFVKDGKEIPVMEYDVQVSQTFIISKGESFNTTIKLADGQKAIAEVKKLNDTATDPVKVDITKDGTVTVLGITRGSAIVRIVDATDSSSELMRYIFNVYSGQKNVTVGVGKTYTFGFSSDNSVDVSVKSDDTSIATTDVKVTLESDGRYHINGTITGVKEGKTVVYLNNNHYIYNVTVVKEENPTPDPDTPVTTENVTVTAGDTVSAPNVLGLNTEPNITFTYDVSGIAAATVTRRDGGAGDAYKYLLTVNISGLKAGTTTVNMYDNGVLIRKYNVTVTAKEEHVPVVPSVSSGYVNIDNKRVGNNDSVSLLMTPETRYTMDPVGAGTDNTSPGEGDVRFVPKFWWQEGSYDDNGKPRYQTSWEFYSSKGISSAKDIPFRIYYVRQTYTNGRWEPSTMSNDATYAAGYYTKHTIKTIAYDPSTGTPTSSGSGTSTYSGSSTSSGSTSTSSSTGSRTTATGHTPTVTGGATGSTQVGNARTGDSAPVGTMLLLGMMSLLTGGYVVSRKRKEDEYDI